MRWIVLALCLLACSHRPPVQAAFLTHDWRLESINGQAFAAPVTMVIRPSGLVRGRTPCNAFAATLSRFPPGWEFGPIAIGNTACADGNFEAAFVQAIAQVTRSQVQGLRLILTGPGIRMEFIRSSRVQITPM
jgi:heat shock protein HslJ